MNILVIVQFYPYILIFLHNFYLNLSNVPYHDIFIIIIIFLLYYFTHVLYY